jgi:ABC-2 type transport system ATP-binding protein
MEPAVRLRAVTKTFGATEAVTDLDLDVPRGSLCGFIGPNGAGKTTTIRMIMAIQFPDRGELEVLGCRRALDAKDRVGYLPEERGLYRKMKVGAFLRFMGHLKNVPGYELDRRVATWLERVDLGGVADKKCEELSKGMQQKVQFVAAVLNEPQLLILDEPFSGLDPVSTRLLRDLFLEQHARGATILFSTHQMAHAEQLCDRIVMIDRGRKVLDDSLAAIRAHEDVRQIVCEPLDNEPDLAPLRALPFVAAAERDGPEVRVTLHPDADAAAVLPAVAAALPSRRVELRRVTLEDVFVKIVTRERAHVE